MTVRPPGAPAKPALPARPLGRAPFAVSALGFGVSGPLGLTPFAAADVAGLVRRALELGVALFDVAPSYGAAEKRLGAALAGTSAERARISTKAGTERVGGRLIKDFRPEAVDLSLTSSLRRLRRDRIDLLLLHGPAPEDLNDGLRARLEARVAAGDLAAYGVCGRGVELLAAIERRFGAAIQAPVFEGPPGGGLWSAAAAAAEMGFIGIEALRAGLSRRRLRRPADLWYAARDWRYGRLAPAQAPEAPAARIARALASPDVSSLLITTTRLKNLEANVAAALGALGHRT